MKPIGRINLFFIITIIIFAFAGLACAATTSTGSPDSDFSTISGYSDLRLGSDVTEVFGIEDEYTLQSIMEYAHYGDSVNQYTRAGKFVTGPETLTTTETIYIRDETIVADSIRIQFTRHRVLFGAMTEWEPDVACIGEIREMIRNKYSADLISHNFFTLGRAQQEPGIKLILRDSDSNILMLKWDSETDTSAVLSINYATGDFFDEFWGDDELQMQIDKL